MSLYLGTSPIASTSYDKANINLSNLTNTGKNIANWSNNVTNCITEIPQDIKLELNSGTLTLKAGSKVYVPNGFEQDGITSKFDTVTITNDISMTQSGVATWLLYYTPNGDLDVRTIPNSYSGSTAPTSSSTYLGWYDTTNNLLKFSSDAGSTWTNGYSLPIAIVTSETNSSYTSIDQVFNGFGYIGSTVFALPGVKGLIPNGRNADGTLKNIESTLTKVHTYWLNPTWGTNLSGHKFYLRVFDEDYPFPGDVQPDTRVTYSKGIPSSNYTGYFYNTDENKGYWVNSGVIDVQNPVFIGASFTANITSSTFTIDGNWNPKTAFHALDYNDSSTISGWSMPSSRYIDLTLGASGSQYTAPVNGWLFFSKGATAANQEVYIADMNEQFAWQDICPVSGQYCQITVPWEKGHTYKVIYGLAGRTVAFRLIYAEGEN